MEIFYVLLKTSDYNEFLKLFQKFGNILINHVVIIPLILPDEIKEGYLLEIKMEINSSGIKKLEKSTKLREQIYWLSTLDKKLYHICDIFSEMSITETILKNCLEENPIENFKTIFEKNLNKEEKLFKWFKLLYFMVNTKFELKIKNRTLNYWIELLENTNENLFLRLGNNPEILSNPELSLNDSIFFSKQKILIKILEDLHNNYPENFYEILIEKIISINKGIGIINKEKESYVKISQFQFIRYFSEKFKTIKLRIKEIEIGVNLLEHLLNTKIWELFEYEKGILDDCLIKFGNSEDDFEVILNNHGIKSITALSELIIRKIENLLKDLEIGRYHNILIIFRLRFLNYLLKFNQKFIYQKKILNLIKSCRKTKNLSNLLNLEIYVMEIKYYNQLKDFKKIKHIKNIIECVENINSDFLIEELRYKKRSTMILEEVDNKLFYVDNIYPKEFEFRKTDLILKLIITINCNLDHLLIKDLELTLKTENEKLDKINTIKEKEINLKKGYNNIDLEILYPKDYRRKLNYLILNKMEFFIGGIKYNLLDFDKIQRKNININDIPYFSVKNSGFIHKFGENQIFFEEANPNYYFIDFSLYNNKTLNLKNLKIEIQKSSKYLIIDKEVEILGNETRKSVTMNDCEILLDEINCGNYLMLLKIYILQKKSKNYKLKINLFYKEKQIQNYLSLKKKNDKFYYLKTKFDQINDIYSQLVLKNNFQGQKIKILEINNSELDPPKPLCENEEFSKIIKSKNLESINLTYIIEGLILKNLEEHFLIKKYLPDLLLEKSKIKTKIYLLENLLKNNEININSLKIKNKNDLKIFEQNNFIMNYSFKNENKNKDSMLYLELKWPKEKYIIVGTTRFELFENVDHKIREITFLCIESGYAYFPKLMLVEIKKDGSEHQHLLNDFQSSNTFFIKENLVKTCKFDFEN